jgi:hypothetical protein
LQSVDSGKEKIKNKNKNCATERGHSPFKAKVLVY